MRGNRGVLMMAAAIVLLGAAPAAAETSISFTDPCGDAERVLTVPPFHVDVGTPRTARHDIARTSLSPLVEGGAVTGLRVTLETCGPIPAPDQLESAWTVSAQLADGCAVSVRVFDEGGPAGTSRSARFTKYCMRTFQSVPNGPAVVVSDTRFSFVLPLTAAAVDGSRITWTLRRAAYGGEAIGALAAGSVWSGVTSTTYDEAHADLFEDPATGVSAAGPGGADRSSLDQPYTLG